MSNTFYNVTLDRLASAEKLVLSSKNIYKKQIDLK